MDISSVESMRLNCVISTFIFGLLIYITMVLYVMKDRNEFFVFLTLSTLAAVSSVFILASTTLFPKKKEIVDEYKYSITVEDIAYDGKSMYVKDDTTSRMVKVDSKELNIVDNNGSAEVTKSSYKFLFITSDEYSVCITEDMYKDIIKDK